MAAAGAEVGAVAVTPTPRRFRAQAPSQGGNATVPEDSAPLLAPLPSEPVNPTAGIGLGVLRAVPRLQRSARAVRAARAAREQQGEGGELLASRRLRHAEDELGSLRESFARKIALTELKCEQTVREKDDERNAWYKEKKKQILEVQAALVVMSALFQRRRRRLEAQMETDRRDFEKRQAEFREQVTQLEALRAREKEEWASEMATMKTSYEAQLKRLNDEVSSITLRARHFEDLYSQEHERAERLDTQCGRQQATIAQLQLALTEANQNAELQRRKDQIEALEAELRRLKRFMQESSTREVAALRREVMDYTRFIVQALPPEWHERLENESHRLPERFRSFLPWPESRPPTLEPPLQQPARPMSASLASAMGRRGPS